MPLNVIEMLKSKQQGIRKTTLNRERKSFTPFQMLVSCIISQQILDEKTEEIVSELFSIAKTPEEILKIPIDQLQEILKQSRFYEAKAESIRDSAKHFLNSTPSTQEELMKIKGVGPKTANIVLCLSYNQPYIPVDSNLHRIANRIGWIQTKTPEQTESALKEVLPKEHWSEINGIMMIHGKTICTPRNPRCNECPIKSHCKQII